MRQIEELGISPGPWSAEIGDDDRFVIRDSEGYEIAQAFSGGCDSSIMSAAPDLYDALREAVSDKCVGCCRRIDDENGNCATLCIAGSWRKALSKAAGEEVRNDGV